MSFEPAEGIRRYKRPLNIEEEEERDFIEKDQPEEAKEDEEEEIKIIVKKAPEPQSTYSSVWIVMVILIICNVIGIIYFVPVCLAASSSARMDSNLLQHYKLWTAPHDTTSVELNIYQGKDREIASILQSALAANGNAHACICMHHLALSAEYGSRRACMVQGILMVNPELKGTSTSTNMWRQWSVACQKNPIERKRYQSIYLEWDDVHTNEKHWIRFNGIQSACMQLALEEMDGKVQCSD